LYQAIKVVSPAGRAAWSAPTVPRASPAMGVLLRPVGPAFPLGSHTVVRLVSYALLLCGRMPIPKKTLPPDLVHLWFAILEQGRHVRGSTGPHTRQCRTLARHEFNSICRQYTSQSEIHRFLTRPHPSELPKSLKLSAITWTMRPVNGWMHVFSLASRALLLETGPAPGDTKELLIRLLKRASTELPWPELPGGTADLFDVHLKALMVLSKIGSRRRPSTSLSGTWRTSRGSW
jgi:hypothetical protein